MTDAVTPLITRGANLKPRPIVCQQCGATEERIGRAVYCTACSNERQAERQRVWARRNLASKEKQAAWGEAQKSRAVSRGIEISRDEKYTLAETCLYDVDLLWLNRIAIPFSYAASKNHVWALNGKGHIWQRGESKAYRSALTLAIQASLAGRQVRQNKLWLDIFVQKPNHKGDAVNVIDLVCDAMKDATKLDDRWYCIRRVDWQIVKTGPILAVGFGQESDEDLQVCSYCGRMLPFDMFNKHKGSRNGIGRECKECRSEGSK